MLHCDGPLTYAISTKMIDVTITHFMMKNPKPQRRSAEVSSAGDPVRIGREVSAKS